VLYSFGSNGDGHTPSSPLLVANGTIFGTTATGLGTDSKGGSVFALHKPTSPGGTWTETILHEFTGEAEPWGNLVMGQDGSLYGTVSLGPNFSVPASGRGAVYMIKLATGEGAF
jgi:hypothetical protein